MTVTETDDGIFDHPSLPTSVLDYLGNLFTVKAQFSDVPLTSCLPATRVTQPAGCVDFTTSISTTCIPASIGSESTCFTEVSIGTKTRSEVMLSLEIPAETIRKSARAIEYATTTSFLDPAIALEGQQGGNNPEQDGGQADSDDPDAVSSQVSPPPVESSFLSAADTQSPQSTESDASSDTSDRGEQDNLPANDSPESTNSGEKSGDADASGNESPPLDNSSTNSDSEPQAGSQNSDESDQSASNQQTSQSTSDQDEDDREGSANVPTQLGPDVGNGDVALQAATSQAAASQGVISEAPPNDTLSADETTSAQDVSPVDPPEGSADDSSSEEPTGANDHPGTSTSDAPIFTFRD